MGKDSVFFSAQRDGLYVAPGTRFTIRALFAKPCCSATGSDSKQVVLPRFQFETGSPIRRSSHWLQLLSLDKLNSPMPQPLVKVSSIAMTFRSLAWQLGTHHLQRLELRRCMQQLLAYGFVPILAKLHRILKSRRAARTALRCCSCRWAKVLGMWNTVFLPLDKISSDSSNEASWSWCLLLT